MQRTASRFGMSVDEWDTAVGEVRAAILRAAEEGRTISYSEIAQQVESVNLDPHSSLMSHLLGAVFRAEHEAGRPALTALVTHKYGDKEPGPGFYEMARHLGYTFREPYLFWSQQVEEVIAAYDRSRRRVR